MSINTRLSNEDFVVECTALEHDLQQEDFDEDFSSEINEIDILLNKEKDKISKLNENIDRCTNHCENF